MTWHSRLIVWLLFLLVPLALWFLAAVVLRERLGVLYRRHFENARRERLFLSAASFFLAFSAARTVAYAVHREAISFRGVFVGGRHVHHLVFGILLLLLVGYLWLVRVGTGEEEASRNLSRLTALLYGGGAALTLDEFALWFNLADVYWAREGRESVDAVILFATILSLRLGRVILPHRNHRGPASAQTSAATIGPQWKVKWPQAAKTVTILKTIHFGCLGMV